ncbi:MAG: hypothetical protein COS25_00305 [Candidatus Nealsonbacteria bacterium CG02_land_8_20_14_3_00_37_10]|uniref:Uncharacterized protein n=1 Tax=Candidatus Nealsonbacteria bacterium CG02_land_8_20_14_3_00_37_10 TaxID=1974699 RepID=A0A2M7DA55_9BACT|nr:MAG: hypothetical protein COS25_00305 [Candidatus Nealsonbacteria bacterium CG02_land_8_20_14_3_00_37_10]
MAETTTKNGKRNIIDLEREVNLLRSFLIGIAGKDREGRYRSEFVKKILKAAKKGGKFVFKDRSSFLARLREK